MSVYDIPYLEQRTNHDREVIIELRRNYWIMCKSTSNVSLNLREEKLLRFLIRLEE